jgi:hypothetical protein
MKLGMNVMPPDATTTLYVDAVYRDGLAKLSGYGLDRAERTRNRGRLATKQEFVLFSRASIPGLLGRGRFLEGLKLTAHPGLLPKLEMRADIPPLLHTPTRHGA